MKTISELNEKMLYRLVKVVYALIFIVLILSSLLGVYSSNSVKYLSKEALLTQLKWAKYIVPLPAPDDLFLSYSNNYATESIKDKSSIEMLGKIAKATYPGAFGQNSNYEIGKEINNNYFINYPHKEALYKSSVKIILYSLLAVIFWLLIAEAIRRIFYYIVLGSLLPPK